MTRSEYVAGVDVGGTKCLAVVIDADNNIVAESRVATPSGTDALIEVAVEVTRELADVAGGLSAAGFGVPGQLDLQGRMRFAPNLVGVGELAIRERLADVLDVPVFVDNNANCAAVAELEMGAASEVRQAVLITLGGGFGNSIIVDGCCSTRCPWARR